MKKQMLILLLLLLINASFGKIVGTPKNRLLYEEDNLAIFDINITDEEYSGTARIRICLQSYDFIAGKFNSAACEKEIKRENIILENNYYGIIQAPLTGIPDSLYKYCIYLKKEGISSEKQDCGSDNILLIKPKPPKCPELPNCSQSKEAAGIIISISSPHNASAGEKITLKANITNIDETEEIIIYSFLKNSTDCINENLNEDSYKILTISKGSSATITLQNQLLKEILPGFYEYTVIAQAGKNYQTSNTVMIQNESEQHKISKCPEIKPCPECICEKETLQPPAPNQSKITAQLNLKRDEYYYIPAIIIGLISLIIMYIKIK